MQVIPIQTIQLFAPLEAKLIELLQSLTPEEWNQPTIAKQWNVKDVAAHLLDGNLRSISFLRDQYAGDPPGMITSNNDLVQYLNRLNADFVAAMKRVSPALLTEMLALTGNQFHELVGDLDPFAPAAFAVSWAGDTVSPNWFHIAREYTERWHHQQQIRDAVNRPGIVTDEFYYPVLDTFMMALPFTYRNTNAEKNTVVQITVTGPGGGQWFIKKENTWVLYKESRLPVTAHVKIDGSVAWKLFTKSWRKKDIEKNTEITGETMLVVPALEMVAVMA